MDLQKLSEKVKEMLDGEKKRREVALEFANRLQEILEPVAPDIWSGDTVWIKEPSDYDSQDNYDQLSVYFRWNQSCPQIQAFNNADEYYESCGFYATYGSSCIRGDSITDIYGREFWYAIQVLVEWVPLVAELMEKKEKSRDELLSLLA